MLPRLGRVRGEKKLSGREGERLGGVLGKTGVNIKKLLSVITWDDLRQGHSHLCFFNFFLSKELGSFRLAFPDSSETRQSKASEHDGDPAMFFSSPVEKRYLSIFALLCKTLEHESSKLRIQACVKLSFQRYE